MNAAPASPPNAAGSPVKKGDHVFLVDGSSYIFRAYHALPPLTRKSDGMPVGAVAGFCNMLWKLLRDMKAEDAPTHLAVVFDRSEKTFRNEIYPQYKAHRPEAPEDLIPQFALIRDAVRAFDLPSLEQAGFEADDLIATYARQAADAGAKVTIVASDKDLMQLVGERVELYDTMKDRRIGPAEVAEKFGVAPDKVIEVQALAGDSVDNVPGVPGIGIKTAAQLINEYGDLEMLLARAGEIKQPKRRETLVENADQARLSLRLVRLDDAVPLDVPLDEIAVHEPDPRNLIGFLKAMEFNTLTRRVAAYYEADASAIDADTKLSAPAGGAAEKGEPAPAAFRGADEASRASDLATPEGAMNPQAFAAARAQKARETKIDRTRYECVRSLDDLRRWIARAHEQGFVAFDCETTSLDPMQADLCGFSLALAPNLACYVPLTHKAQGEADGLFAGGLIDNQIGEGAALDALKPLLESDAVLKIGQNLKFDALVFAQRGIAIDPIDDTMLMSYVLDAGRASHGMDALSQSILGHAPISFDEVTGTGKARITFDRVALDRASEYAAEDADVTLRLWQVLKPRLVAEHMMTVYQTLERPMVGVLTRMEQRGISIDRQVLSRLSVDFAQKAARLQDEIHELAGEPLNPASPKQLGDVLFGKMGLPGAKKTKTGAWSTSASVLEELAEEGHELPRKILDWRQVSKLKSTYTDALPTYLHPQTHRVHTSYALAATTTGRLSSSEPNLQNIPVRTEEGRKIRRAFIAEHGCQLISADYSQIELRLLAEIADIAALKKAFQDGLDIHAMTASEMFGVPIKDMPSDVRRRAKAINFGIIYGISAFGLANQLGISREEAGAYIKTYFERFPGIRDYMEATKEFCREHGYVTTLFGRKCHYPDIKASNAALRAFNERAAINARLQGTAADIIRRAMVHMENALANGKFATRMLLQVHDELIFEAPDNEVKDVIAMVRKIMAQAPLPAVALHVPLEVEARAAQNWDEAH